MEQTAKEDAVKNDKQLYREVVRQVHPDRFLADAHACERNTASLQVLNAYADELFNSGICKPAALRFFVRRNNKLKEIMERVVGKHL
ncbi:hypothetical protein WJX73_004315 [Symbiochloris irregularis]|uniref:DUF4460 domain-containing protein n=1 Tax=Symbiochloris irregularis TaxID=706552 RepID=A0AAW1NQ77_9CHLO